MELEQAENYFVTQDTRALFSQLTLGTGQALDEVQLGEIDNLADEYFQGIRDVLRTFFNQVVAFSEVEINQALRDRIKLARESIKNLVVVCLDRFLLSSRSENPTHRFSINRRTNGELSPRVCQLPFQQQAGILKEQIGNHPVMVVDDGIVNGGTMRIATEQLEKSGLDIRKILVFGGNPTIDAVGGVKVDRVHDFNGIDWVNARDFSPFGGIPRSQFAYSYMAAASPYVAPFSGGERAGFTRSPKFLKLSYEINKLSLRILKELEAILGLRLTNNHLVNAQLPTMLRQSSPSEMGDMPTSICDVLEYYVDQNLELLEGGRPFKLDIPMVGCL